MSFARELAAQTARFLHFGVPYGELVRLREAEGWPQFAEALAARADHYRALAAQARESGRGVSALAHERVAAAAYHYAQIKLPRGARALALQEECRAAFRRLAPSLAPAAEPVSIRFGEARLPGYRRILPGRPLVLLINGLDSAKEVELAAFADGFVARGLSVAAIDLPGLGALNGVLPLARFDDALAAILETLRADASAAPALGVFGVSYGGHLAMRAAALMPEFAAAISLGGFFDFAPMRRLPPAAADNLRRAWGDAEAAALEPWMDLSALPRPPEARTLILHGGRDHLVERDQVERLARWIPHARLVVYDGAEHVCTDRFSECLPLLWDFMAEALS